MTMDLACLRIIDANLNRAREALRVMEEHARFVLDDAGLTAAIKGLRHDLAAAVPAFLAGPLAAARETGGDVGRSIGTPSEYERASPAAVAVAAGKRLTEALRAIEEYGKIIDPKLAADIERLRYRAYEVEQRIALLPLARSRFGQVRLYVIVTEALCHRPWLDAAAAAIAGGADCIQLREKSIADGELLDRARRLVDLCHSHGTICLINDRPDIAALAGADGVHVGQGDLGVHDARRTAGPDAIVGISTHNLEQVAAAVAACPDYVAVGPMFATATKPQDHVAGPATLRAARELTALPLVAIGGIDADRGPEVLSAAPCCLCVCSAIIGDPDPERAAGAIRALFADE
jgi:thiamine-phosphate pyrophosphorylase